MHVFKGLLRCKSVCDVKPGLDPCPLLARSWNRWRLDFVSFIAYKKVKIKFKKAKCVSDRCNDLFKRKKYFGFRCTLMVPRVLHLDPVFSTKTPCFPPDPVFTTPCVFHQTPCFLHPGTPYPGTPAPRFLPSVIVKSKSGQTREKLTLIC